VQRSKEGKKESTRWGEAFDGGSGLLEVSDDDESNNGNQSSIFYSRRPKCVEVDCDYELTCERGRRMIKYTQRFGYVDLISNVFTTP